MNIQIRVRTDEPIKDIVGKWYDNAPKAFIFEHNKPGNHHYHVYLFDYESHTALQKWREYLTRRLGDKSLHMVGTTAGKKKNPITIQNAYNYGCADRLSQKMERKEKIDDVSKLLDRPIFIKGFIVEEGLHQLHDEAEKFWNVMVGQQAKQESVVVIQDLLEVKTRPDLVWKSLYENRASYRDLTIPKIKSKLAVERLREGKAIMRSADAHRYALSLYYLNKYNGEEIPDDALVCHFEND